MIKNFKQYVKIFEDGEGGMAAANMGNSGTGMGPVVPPASSSVPGQVWTGTPADYVKGGPGGIGSGDVPAYDQGKKFAPLKNKNKKGIQAQSLKKKNKKEGNPYGWDKGYQSMYVTNFSGWADTYGKNTVK